MVHANYQDITSRIPSPPNWFDEHAVPRYCGFHPNHSASIYVPEVALVEIGCQRCGRAFRVAISQVNFPEAPIADAIRAENLSFGDPPSHLHILNGEPCTGNTMSSRSRKVVEYWHRHDRRYLEGTRITNNAFFDWGRDQTLEIAWGVER